MNKTVVRSPLPAGSARDIVAPGDLRMSWIIAWRATLEALHDRMTLSVSTVFALVVPILVVLLLVRPDAARLADPAAVGTSLAIYLLAVGLMPSSGSVGIASGLFAGEREHGNLLPLLASPASNRAIFAGKVLGAVLPALLYAGIAEVSYLAEIGLFFGVSTLQLLPLALSLAMLALVPADALLGAAVASLVSSRVRTYQSAQMISGLALYPLMAALFGLLLLARYWGPWALAGAVALVFVVDAVLIVFGAATWQREEVMARR